MKKPKIITTILEDEQYEIIRKLAFTRRNSMAKTIREIIDDYFKLKAKEN
jgi:hypothetical protein